MTKKYDVAIVGATGMVGETLIEALAEYNFPVNQLFPLASENSLGKTVVYKNKNVPVQVLDDFDFSQTQIAFFSAGGSVSADYAEKAVAAGNVVIDNTSHFRYEDDIPLVVPEVNPEAIADYKNRGIIANPNCSTIQMLVALKPLHDLFGIKKIHVATYQAVSGTGKKAVQELASQTSQLLGGMPIKDPQVYPKQIAFNTIPFIDVINDNGYTREEMKMLWETRKIFGDENIAVNATCVRVPVFVGHSEAVHIETTEEIDLAKAKKCLKQAPGVVLIDDAEDFPTAVTDAANNNKVYVGRVRADLASKHGLNLWVVADNVRKGAATNSIEIAQQLINDYI